MTCLFLKKWEPSQHLEASPFIRERCFAQWKQLVPVHSEPLGHLQAASGPPLKNLATEFVSWPNPSYSDKVLLKMSAQLCSLIETSLSLKSGARIFFLGVKFWFDPFKEQRTGQPGTKCLGTELLLEKRWESTGRPPEAHRTLEHWAETQGAVTFIKQISITFQTLSPKMHDRHT